MLKEDAEDFVIVVSFTLLITNSVLITYNVCMGGVINTTPL